jgi:hypothetical protein
LLAAAAVPIKLGTQHLLADKAAAALVPSTTQHLLQQGLLTLAAAAARVQPRRLRDKLAVLELSSSATKAHSAVQAVQSLLAMALHTTRLQAQAHSPHKEAT